MIRVPPQRIQPKHYEGIERQLLDIFRTILFEPLVTVIGRANAQTTPVKDVMFNAKRFAENDPLRGALRSGKIQYSLGVFSGQFEAATAKAIRALGGKFDPHEKVYRVNPATVPSWISAEAGAYQVTARETNAALQRTLNYVQDSLDQAIDKYTVKPDHMISEVHTTFRQAASALRISPVLTEESKARLADEYTDNMKLWIQKFSEEMIGELRGVVEENAMQGYRFDKLMSGIENRYAVTRNKAKFLARQETALFMSKYRELRYSEAGVTRYRWRTAGDERVRESHKHLNGKIFSYDDPPIVQAVGKGAGRRANPGQDFNCRCIDEPILSEAKYQEAA